jgi:hypothetical protein
MKIKGVNFMFNKQTIKNVISELGLENEYYKVFMGGSLCVRDIRETHDIDLGVEPETFERLRERLQGTVYESKLGNDKFDLEHECGHIEIFKCEDFYDDIEKVEGIWCQKIESIIKMKVMLHREKDREDLRLIYGKIKGE